jgi:hypothetical protein
VIGGLVYAIPSRARARTLTEKTLPLLRRLGAVEDGSRVDLWVETTEHAAYRAELVRAGFREGGDLDDAWCRLRDGAAGMRAQRLAIGAGYARGTPVIQLDDDLSDLVLRLDEQHVESLSPEAWAVIVAAGFVAIRNERAVLWSIYPVPNPYFMRPRVRRGALVYCGGGLFGYYADPSAGWWRVTLDDKEDFERSIRAHLAGGVVRFDNVAWVTKGYAGAGGMQEDGLRTPERILASARRLVELYPNHAALNLTKRSGKAEVRLLRRRW